MSLVLGTYYVHDSVYTVFYVYGLQRFSYMNSQAFLKLLCFYNATIVTTRFLLRTSLPFVFPCFATGAPSPLDCLLCVCKELKHLLWVLVPSLSFVLFPMWLALYMVFFDCVSPLLSLWGLLYCACKCVPPVVYLYGYLSFFLVSRVLSLFLLAEFRAFSVSASCGWVVSVLKFSWIGLSCYFVIVLLISCILFWLLTLLNLGVFCSFLSFFALYFVSNTKSSPLLLRLTSWVLVFVFLFNYPPYFLKFLSLELDHEYSIVSLVLGLSRLLQCSNIIPHLPIHAKVVLHGYLWFWTLILWFSWEFCSSVFRVGFRFLCYFVSSSSLVSLTSLR